jgi:hypothetical protein
MAFRAQEAALGLMLAAGLLGADASVAVRHDHLRGYGTGSVTANESGLSFAESGDKAKHKWTLSWDDIQQVWISPKKLRVLLYADTWWKLGADREYELDAAPDATFAALQAALREKLDGRVVVALADTASEVLWRIPAKLRERFGGPEGVLVVGADRIVFESPEKGKSRTWLFSDIDNISSSGPFDFTVTSFERSKGDYGDRRSFNFQLKERLAESRYNELWRKLNGSKQVSY